jgi:hypothetical protein
LSGKTAYGAPESPPKKRKKAPECQSVWVRGVEVWCGMYVFKRPMGGMCLKRLMRQAKKRPAACQGLGGDVRHKRLKSPAIVRFVLEVHR